jgi:hypothetical protein
MRRQRADDAPALFEVETPGNLVHVHRPGAPVESDTRVHHIDPWGSSGECAPVRGNGAPVTVAFVMLAGNKVQCPKCAAIVDGI